MSESEKLCVLKSNYLFRIDVTRKIIEHVGKQDDDDEEVDDEVSTKKIKMD